MTDTLDAFKGKFRVRDLLVKDYRFWTWSVRPQQGTLGASIIALKRPAGAWSDVSPEENAELSAIVLDLEKKCASVFAYDRMNYLMLMMVDPHVHFHVFPRYSTPKKFAEMEWNDGTYPKLADLFAGVVPDEVLLKIKNALAN